MNTLEVRFYRFKMNHVKCSCGVSKRFTTGNDARYFADMHRKCHEKRRGLVETLMFDNDEPIVETRTARPGRAAGGVSLQNLY